MIFLRKNHTQQPGRGPQSPWPPFQVLIYKSYQYLVFAENWASEKGSDASARFGLMGITDQHIKEPLMLQEKLWSRYQRARRNHVQQLLRWQLIRESSHQFEPSGKKTDHVWGCKQTRRKVDVLTPRNNRVPQYFVSWKLSFLLSFHYKIPN